MHAVRENCRTLVTLTKRSDFLHIAAHGRKWVSLGLIIQVCPNALAVRRQGFTVTKMVSKSAVRRNRIKRRLRAVAAEILPLQAQGGMDYVLIGRPLTATRPYAALRGDLLWCLGKLGALSQTQAGGGT